MNPKLKAFVKYVQNYGPVTLLKRERKPSSGQWLEIPMSLCCPSNSPIVLAYSVTLTASTIAVGGTSTATAQSVNNAGNVATETITSATSSNTAVATVSGSTITAVAEGIAFIKFTLSDGVVVVKEIEVVASEG